MDKGRISKIARIGCYILGAKLGEGSFAIVRKAHHLASDEQVAMKLFDKKAVGGEQEQIMLQREGQILRSLRHAHIIPLLEIIDTTDLFVRLNFCLVMGLAARDMLTKLCDEGVYDEAEARRLFRQLLSAVEYMHDVGVVHRDLKVENLMLDALQNLLLVDFGLGNTLLDVGFLTTQCGSLAYSAPELLSKKPYGREVDIWSAGVCLFVMLVGSLPFPPNTDVTEHHARVLDGNYTLPPDAGAILRDLFLQLFEARPHRRISVAELWAHPWVAGPAKEGRYVAKPPPGLEGGVDAGIVAQIMRIVSDVREDAVVQAVVEHKCNRLTALYFLLAQRQETQRQRAPCRLTRTTSGSKQLSTPPPMAMRRNKSLPAAKMSLASSPASARPPKRSMAPLADDDSNAVGSTSASGRLSVAANRPFTTTLSSGLVSVAVEEETASVDPVFEDALNTLQAACALLEANVASLGGGGGGVVSPAPGSSPSLAASSWRKLAGAAVPPTVASVVLAATAVAANDKDKGASGAASSSSSCGGERQGLERSFVAATHRALRVAPTRDLARLLHTCGWNGILYTGSVAGLAAKLPAVGRAVAAEERGSSGGGTATLPSPQEADGDSESISSSGVGHRARPTAALSLLPQPDALLAGTSDSLASTMSASSVSDMELISDEHEDTAAADPSPSTHRHPAPPLSPAPARSRSPRSVSPRPLTSMGSRVLARPVSPPTPTSPMTPPVVLLSTSWGHAGSIDLHTSTVGIFELSGPLPAVTISHEEVPSSTVFNFGELPVIKGANRPDSALDGVNATARSPSASPRSTRTFRSAAVAMRVVAGFTTAVPPALVPREDYGAPQLVPLAPLAPPSASPGAAPHSVAFGRSLSAKVVSSAASPAGARRPVAPPATLTALAESDVARSPASPPHSPMRRSTSQRVGLARTTLSDQA